MFFVVLICGCLGTVAQAGKVDFSSIPNEAPLDFSFRDCGAHHEYLGPSANIGNGLVVAFNGTHTRIMNTNVFQNGASADAGFWAWDIIDDGSGDSAPQARVGHVIAPLGNYSLLMFGGMDTLTNAPLDDSWVFQVDADDLTRGAWTLRTKEESGSPSARISHAMAPLGEGEVLLYGGLTFDETEEFLDDVWIFADDSWTQVNSSLHNSPGPRFGHSLVSLGGGGNSGAVMMFGGVYQGDNESTTVQDTWVFDSSTRNWQEIKTNSTEFGLPPPRQGHATALTKVFDVDAVLMYGGYDSPSADFEDGNGTYVLKDTWMLYMDSMTWKIAADFDYDPNPRFSHHLTTIGDEGRVILLHGGMHFDSFGDPVTAVDAWTYQSPGNIIDYHEWSPQVDGPPARSYHAMASLEGGRTLMYGGFQVDGDDYTPLNDAWIFHLEDGSGQGYNTKLPGKWQRTKDGPSARHSHAMASVTDSLTSKVLMFGGRNSEEVLGDAWIFTCDFHRTYACDVGTGTWTLTDNTTAYPTPSARYGHDMATLEFGNVVLFGGRDANADALGDTWIYDLRRYDKATQSNGRWEPATAFSGDDGPSARYSHAMAALDGNRVMLYGGMDGDEDYALADVWIYEGPIDNLGWGVWEQQEDGPVARYGHAMASLGGGRAILHGGQVDGDEYSEEPSAKVHLIYNVAESSDEVYSYKFMHLPASQEHQSQRFGHAMAPLKLGILSGSAYRVLLFGGTVVHTTFGATVDNTDRSDSDDTWTLLAGCPAGASGPECNPCKNGTYSESVTADFDSCLSCPVGTTTVYNGSNTSTQCTLCEGYSPGMYDANGGLYVSCHVDLNTSLPIWRCNGRWGEQCEFECPGGVHNVCNGRGFCSDGVDGTGECTCEPGFYGGTCEFPCNCGGHGKCDDGIYGSGSCSCNFFYMLSGSNCTFPTVAFLLVNFFVVGITIVIMKRNPASRRTTYAQPQGGIESNSADTDLYAPLGSGNKVNEGPSHLAMEMGRRSPEVTDHGVTDRGDSAASGYVPPSLGNDDAQVDDQDDEDS